MHKDTGEQELKRERERERERETTKTRMHILPAKIAFRWRVAV
jgi:hypothetical protein